MGGPRLLPRNHRGHYHDDGPSARPRFCGGQRLQRHSKDWSQSSISLFPETLFPACNLDRWCLINYPPAVIHGWPFLAETLDFWVARMFRLRLYDMSGCTFEFLRRICVFSYLSIYLSSWLITGRLLENEKNSGAIIILQVFSSGF